MSTFSSNYAALNTRVTELELDSVYKLFSENGVLRGQALYTQRDDGIWHECWSNGSVYTITQTGNTVSLDADEVGNNAAGLELQSNFANVRKFFAMTVEIVDTPVQAFIGLSNDILYACVCQRTFGFYISDSVYMVWGRSFQVWQHEDISSIVGTLVAGDHLSVVCRAIGTDTLYQLYKNQTLVGYKLKSQCSYCPDLMSELKAGVVVASPSLSHLPKAPGNLPGHLAISSFSYNKL